jgi:hypothetical protein
VLDLERQLSRREPDLQLLHELDKASRDRLRRVFTDVLAGGPGLRPQLVPRAVAHGVAGASPAEAFMAALRELVP